jgi:hypothetical protein
MTDPCEYPEGVQRANAELIVRVVNSLSDLLKSLQELVAAISMGGSLPAYAQKRLMILRRAAEAAVAKAKGPVPS